jgi:PAS domain S-box-containing protein
MRKKLSGLESVLGRLDNLDDVNLQNLVQRLARERHLLEAVFNTIREGILVINRRGLIEYSNAAGHRLLGFAHKDIGTASLWKQVPDLSRTLSLTSEGIIRERVGITREIRVSYPELRMLRFYMVPFHDQVDSEDQVVEDERRYVVILTDITEEQQTTEQKIESEKISSILHLAAGVAHELGNPLNSLTIHLQLIQRQLKRLSPVDNTEKLTQSIEICAGEVSRLDSIIKHFLEAVRPQSPDLGDVDLVVVLEETLQVMEPELAAAGVTVDVSLDGATPPVVTGDSNQIKQVLFNVLKNAREAMKVSGVIKIRTRTDDDFVYICVVDSGEGIDEQDLMHVFDPYFTTKKEGHGLGMMVVQRIMRDHGGQIGIDSRKGVGTVVTLQFPQKHRRVRMLDV